MSNTNVEFNSGTREQVALELMKFINLNINGYHTEESILNLYEKCRKAVNASGSISTAKVVR